MSILKKISIPLLFCLGLYSQDEIELLSVEFFKNKTPFTSNYGLFVDEFLNFLSANNRKDIYYETFEHVSLEDGYAELISSDFKDIDKHLFEQNFPNFPVSQLRYSILKFKAKEVDIFVLFYVGKAGDSELVYTLAPSVDLDLIYNIIRMVFPNFEPPKNN